jgi:8-oxo-dGTP pyrophosphatase MutT (NUDIX family)
VSPRRSALRKRLTSLGYGIFYRLHPKVRLHLVRLATPTYTVGAVVLIFSPRRERLLLLRQPPGRGWSLPAGLLERGETTVQGAVREAAEETGLDLDPLTLVAATPNAVVHTNGRWVDTVFTTEVDPAAVTLDVDGAEVWEAAWHDLRDLPKLTVASARLLGVYGIGPNAADEPKTGGISGVRRG